MIVGSRILKIQASLTAHWHDKGVEESKEEPCARTTPQESPSPDKTQGRGGWVTKQRGYFPQDWSSLPAGTPSGGRVGLRLELAWLDRAETPC